MSDFIPSSRVSRLQSLHSRQATSKQPEQWKPDVHPIFEQQPDLPRFEDYARRLKGIRIGGIYAADADPKDFLSPNPFEYEDALNNNLSGDDDDEAPDYRDTKVKCRAWETHQLALPLYDKPPTEADQPPFVRLPLKPYQLKGLQRMAELEDNVGAVIQADDMGLGKTLQTLALIAMQKANGNVVGPTIIIVPKMLLKQWQAEIEKFLETDAITFATYYKDAGEHVSHDDFRPSRLCNYDIVLTTYETVAAEYKADLTSKSRFFRRKHAFESGNAGHGHLSFDDEEIRPETALPTTKWARVVLDEATAIKNCDSQRSEAACALHGPKRVILTGTPYLCSYKDLGGYFRFLRIRPWGNIDTYRHYFCNVKKGSSNKTYTISGPIGDILIIMFWFVVVRRMKKDVNFGLPDLMERRIMVPFNKVRTIQYRHPDDKEVYDFTPEYEPDTQWMVRSKWDPSAPKVEGCTGASHIHARLSACHPLAHRAVNDGDASGIKESDKIKSAWEDEILTDERWRSSKIEAVIAEVRVQLAEKGKDEKILIFHTNFSIIFAISVGLKANGIEFLMLTGDVATATREKELLKFKKEGVRRVLLATTATGSQGLNLPIATVVMLVAPDYVPGNEHQAISRAHRIGQTRVVEVIRFITMDSIEELIVKEHQEERIDQNMKLIVDRQMHSTIAQIRGWSFNDFLGKVRAVREGFHSAPPLSFAAKVDTISL